MEMISSLVGLVSVMVVVVIVLLRRRLGELRAASWLVALGAFILFSEHPQFAILYGLQAVYPEAQDLVLLPHAKIHFIMAGIYSIIGLTLLVYIAWTHLRAGKKSAWLALLVILLIGGGFDLYLGAIEYQHGSPIYRLIGLEESAGFGWQFLYAYIVSWAGALVVSFDRIFSGQSNRDGAVA